MTDEAGAALAAAETAPVADALSAEAVDTTDAPAEPTPRGSIDRAFEALDAEEAEAPQEKAEPAPEDPSVEPARNEQPRTPDGKFAPKDEKQPKDAEPPLADGEEALKEAVPFGEAPSRFSPDGKAAWKDVPEPVKAEVHRAVTELEQGIEKYRGGAEQWEGLKEFDDLAKSVGTDVKTALGNYVNADKILNADPIRGLDHVARMYGLTLHDVASKVLNQTPDQAQTQANETINELRGQIGELQRQLGSVTTSIKQQGEQRALREIQAFAADHPRFEELSGEIEAQLNAGHTLEKAYERAVLLNPAPPPPVAEPATPEPAAQPGKGSLSVTGAPSPGSNPATSKTSSSAGEALDRAFESVGIR